MCSYKCTCRQTSGAIGLVEDWLACSCRCTRQGVRAITAHSLWKMDSPTCIEDLPDEILVEIFSHLGFEDMVHSVQYVALRWRDIAHDIHLWKDLLYRPPREVHDDKILKLIQQAPKLQTLLLEQRGVRFPVIRGIIENCRHLKKLKFHTNQKFNFLSIRNLFQNCPNIEELYIPGRILSETKSAQCIGHLQNLRTLTVGGWGDESYRIMLKPLGDGCPCLQHIDIRDEYYNIDDLEYFLNKKRHQLQSLKVNWSCEPEKCAPPVLSVCKALKTLHLHNYCDINVEEAFDALRSLKSVTKLTFSSLDGAKINRVISLFNDRAMTQLVEFRIDSYDNYDDRLAALIAKNCPLLKVLQIRYCYNLTNTSLQNLHSLKMLEKLNLTNSDNITEKGMEFLCKCKHLKHLNLRCCDNLTEECMKKVTDLSRTLETIKLDYCNVKGLAIHNIPSHLPNLSLLSLNYCQGVDRAALEKLKIAVPELTVKDDVYATIEEDGYNGQEQDDGEEGVEEMHNEENYIPAEPEVPDILYDDAPFVFEQLQRF